jgi:hypothetical protein
VKVKGPFSAPVQPQSPIGVSRRVGMCITASAAASAVGAERLAHDPAMRTITGWWDGDRPATSTNTQFVTAKGRYSGQAQYPFRGDAAHQTRGIPVPEAQETGLPSVCQATGFWSNMSRIAEAPARGTACQTEHTVRAQVKTWGHPKWGVPG